MSKTKFHCLAIEHNIKLECTPQGKLKILPCCVYQTQQVYSSLDEYNASSEIQQLRSATDWPAGCKGCQQQESLGHTSHRNHAEHALKAVTGRRYEIMPSNVCNLRCVMCDSKYSTALAHERFTVGLDAINISHEVSAGQQQLEILEQDHDIESISLIGGEFFLSKKNLEFLDFVIARKIPLRVVTNATVLLNTHIEKLKKITELELQISIDGVGPGYEFMRYPAEWSVFDTNVKQLIANLPSAKINFHMVVQALNLQQLIPVMHYANQHRRPLRITTLVVPEYLTLSILQTHEQQDLIDLMHEQLQQYRLARVQVQVVNEYIDMLVKITHSSRLRQKFLDQTTAIYSRRTFDWLALKESTLHPRIRNTQFNVD
jgi:organic radical activating enzyme